MTPDNPLYLIVSLAATFIAVLWTTLRSQRKTKEAVAAAKPDILTDAATAADAKAQVRVDSAQELLAKIARDKFDELDKRNRTLTDQVEALTAKVDAGDIERAALERQLAQANTDLKALRDEVGKLREENRAVTAARDIEERRADQLASRLEATETQLKKAESQIETLQREVQRLTIERDVYDRFFDRIQVEVKQVPPPNGSLPTAADPTADPA